MKRHRTLRFHYSAEITMLLLRETRSAPRWLERTLSHRVLSSDAYGAQRVSAQLPGAALTA